MSQTTQAKSEDDFKLTLSEKIEQGQRNIFKIVNNSRQLHLRKEKPENQTHLKKAIDMFNLFLQEAKVPSTKKLI